MTRPTPLILNVDDDDAGRYAVGRQLKQAGFDVVEADTGEAGLRMAASHQPDLILLDVRLPDVDGFEVCRRIRADREIGDIPVVHMSASYLDVSSRVKGLENGADAYLTEPVEASILVATVNSALRSRRAEAGLRTAAVQWQTTFNAIQDGVALLDAEGGVRQSNEAFGKLAGGQREAFEDLTRTVFERFRATGVRQAEEHFPDESTLLFTIDPVKDHKGRFSGAVCTVVDVTERKKFEQQLRHTAKLESIGVLAGGIAHDFNNLLTGILGNSSLIDDTLPAEAPERGLVREIVKASESAADLTRQILAYSGKGRFVTRAVDLSTVAFESRSFVRRFIPARVELKWQLMSNPPLIEADAGQLQQLIMNLVINASESFVDAARGTISVRTEVQELDRAFFHAGERAVPGQYVCLVVEDAGSGMDEATQLRIFDPFFTTKFAGRGLGLSAVHGIMQGHKGVIRLRSKPGAGSTFSLYFPVSGKAALEAPESVTEAAREGFGTVLVIDDESVVRNFAKAALENRGYRVLTAENGEAGVELFRERHEAVDAILLDFTMPVMDGEEAVGHLREISGRVPVILSSGFSHSTAAERFQGKGLAGFLGKPYTGSDLAAAIEAAIRGRVAGDSI